MTLQQLKYFCVMSEMLHYTEAAKQLYVSQSSLSYSLSELEKELGVPLFEKRGKQTVLTQYAEAFLPYATQSLGLLHEGTTRIEQMLKGDTVINLGYIYSLSFDFLPMAINGFRTLPGNGDVSFNFFQGLNSVVLQKLKRDELDLAFSILPDEEGFDSFPVYNQELFVVLPIEHPLAQASSLDIMQLKNEKFVAITQNSSLRQHVDSCLRHLGLEPNVAFEAEECNAMASFIGSQFGVAIMPKIPSLESYRLVSIPIQNEGFYRQVHAIWRRGRFAAPAVDSFKRFLNKAFVVKTI